MHVTTSPSLVIRFPIDPMSEALVEVNQTIKASAELVAKETAIERVPVVGEEVKVDKEEEVVEQIVETILRIQLQNRTPTIPCLSAMQLKLESWLKFHGIKYENVQEKDNLPASALLPMQSNDYLTTLATKEEKMGMPMELDAEQKNIQHAMISLVEKNIHFAIPSWQCSNLENTLKGYNINLQTYLNSKAPLALLKLFFKNNFCKSGLKLVRSNTGNTNSEEIEQLAKNDLKVLAEMLGEKEEQVKIIVDDVVEKATEEKDQETREAAFVVFRRPLFSPLFLLFCPLYLPPLHFT